MRITLPTLMLSCCLVSADLIAASAGDQATTLDAAVALALEKNHEYLDLADRVELAELDFDAARSVFRTQYGASSSSDARSGADTGSYYTFFMDKRNESGSGYKAGIYNSKYGERSLSEFRLEYTLPFFSNPLDTQRLRIDQTEIDLAARKRLKDIGREELIAEVVSAYYRVTIADKSLDLARSRLGIAQRQQQARQMRFDAGEISDLVLARGALALVKGEQEVNRKSFAYKQNKDQFKMLLGMDVNDEIRLESNMQVQVDDSLLAAPLSELEPVALRQRIELIAKREQLMLAEKKVRAAKPTLLPPMEVSIQYSLVGDGEGIDESFAFDDQRIGIGVRMNTDFGSTEEQKKQRRINLRYEAELRQLEQLENAVKVDVRQAHFGVKENYSELEYAVNTELLQERQYRKSQLMYAEGELSDIDLLETEMDLADARHQVIVSQVNYVLAAQRLAKATGHYDQQWRY